MACVENWRDVDRLIKADVVACFDSIDHQILIEKIGKHVGSRNGALLRLSGPPLILIVLSMFALQYYVFF